MEVVQKRRSGNRRTRSWANRRQLGSYGRSRGGSRSGYWNGGRWIGIVCTMAANACPRCGRRLWANGSCACGWPQSKKVKQVERRLPDSLVTGKKCCHVCHRDKPLGFFPQDRSRLDGRWHTCRLCNGNRWREHGKSIAAERKLAKRIAQAQNSRNGILGLRKYHRSGKGLEGLPPDLRYKAQGIISRAIARAKAKGRRLSQERFALLTACAISNARRVGDRSWSRRMLRLKGYRRAERRQAEKEAQLAEIRARNENAPTRHKLLSIW